MFLLSLVKSFLSLPCYNPDSSVFALLPSVELLTNLDLSSVSSLEQSVKRLVIPSKLPSCCKLSSIDYLGRAKEQHAKAFLSSELLGESIPPFPLLLLGVDRLKKALLTLGSNGGAVSEYTSFLFFTSGALA
jgi:hypothetical protein